MLPKVAAEQQTYTNSLHPMMQITYLELEEDSTKM